MSTLPSMTTSRSVSAAASVFSRLWQALPKDYPELPEVETADAVCISQRTLRSMISGGAFCVSTVLARPILTGCAVELEGQTLTLVSVDGYRLAMRQEPIENPDNRSMKFVIPAASLREVERILKDSDDPVYFSLGSKHILFENDQVRLICRLLDGEFMDWRRVIPKDQPIRLTANVKELTSCVERMALITSEKVKNPVRCYFGQNEVDFRTSAAMGMAHDICTLAGDGNGLEIGFNCKFLLDALKAIPTPEVSLELSSGLSPMVMVPCEGAQSFPLYDFAGASESGGQRRMKVSVKPKYTIEPENIPIRTEFIKLDSFLKFCNAVETGAMGKQVVQGGEVKVNGFVCTMRGKKLRPGDIVSFAGQNWRVTADEA